MNKENVYTRLDFGLAIILFLLQWRVQQTENLGRLVLQNSLQVCWGSFKATRT